jgi:hypothetical protein
MKCPLVSILAYEGQIPQPPTIIVGQIVTIRTASVIIFTTPLCLAACGGVVVKALCYKPEGCRVEIPMK